MKTLPDLLGMSLPPDMTLWGAIAAALDEAALSYEDQNDAARSQIAHAKRIARENHRVALAEEGYDAALNAAVAEWEAGGKWQDFHDEEFRVNYYRTFEIPPDQEPEFEVPEALAEEIASRDKLIALWRKILEQGEIPHITG